MPISEEHINISDEVNMSLSRRPIVKTYPQVNLESQYSIFYAYGWEEKIFDLLPLLKNVRSFLYILSG